MEDENTTAGDRGGSRHRKFVNFLATDKVPDSIFGIPVVQDESGYTESDIEFFRKNPKAAGFYDLGEGDDGTQEARGGGDAAEGAKGTGKDVQALVQTFKDHIKSHEARHYSPYMDTDGNWAIGYGSHFLADGTAVAKDTKVTDRDIDAAFEKDLSSRIDLLSGYDKSQAKFAVPNWRYMSPESRLLLLDVAWGRKDTLTKGVSKGLFGELGAAGRNTAALDEIVRRHYPSYQHAKNAEGKIDPSKTPGLQARRIALLKALTGEDFSYKGKKWNYALNRFVETGGSR